MEEEMKEGPEADGFWLLPEDEREGMGEREDEDEEEKEEEGIFGWRV